MLERCTKPNNKYYGNYGGRGVVVCDRWFEFKNFFADMGMKPEGLSLDRIDPDGNYEPSNCRWATQLQQQRNRVANKPQVLFEHLAEVVGLEEAKRIMRAVDKIKEQRKWDAEAARERQIAAKKVASEQTARERSACLRQRSLEALALRLSGMKYREIGQELGVGLTYARSLAMRGERISKRMAAQAHASA